MDSVVAEDLAIVEDTVIAVAAVLATEDENRKILQFNRQVVPIILRGAWDTEAAEATLHVEVTLLGVVVDTEAVTTVHGHTVVVDWADVVVAAMAEAAVQEATVVLQAITVVIAMALHRPMVKWVADISTAVTIRDHHHGSSLTLGNHQTQPQ